MSESGIISGRGGGLLFSEIGVEFEVLVEDEAEAESVGFEDEFEEVNESVEQADGGGDGRVRSYGAEELSVF